MDLGDSWQSQDTNLAPMNWHALQALGATLAKSSFPQLGEEGFCGESSVHREVLIQKQGIGPTSGRAQD